MFEVTWFSIAMAIFWSSIFATLLHIYRKNTHLISLMGVSSLSLLTILTLFRMLFQVDMFYSVVVPSTKIYPFMEFFFYHHIAGSTIKVYQAFLLIWFIVAITVYIRPLIVLYRFIKKYKQIAESYNEKYGDKVKTYNVTVPTNTLIVETSDFSSPFTVGFVQPIIFVPTHLTPSELSFVISHEITHFYHKDAFTKLGIHTIISIFWWNPLFRLLKVNINHTLELKCDAAVTSTLTNKQRLQYLDSLLSIIKKQKTNETNETNATNATIFATAFAQDNSINKSKMAQRFELIVDIQSVKTSKLITSVLLITTVVIMLLGSYLIIIQPHYIPDTSTTDESRPEYIFSNNTYILLHKDGKYCLYVNDIYQSELTLVEVEDFKSLDVTIIKEN